MTDILLINSNSIRIPLVAESVHCVVTSPPYWGLRDYGLPPLIWDSEADCRHVWGGRIVGGEGYSSGQRKRWQHDQNRTDNPENWQKQTTQGQFCQLCHAWRGCLGLEPTPELYVQHLIQVFREVRRVLRRDGCLWLNLGSSYASSGVRQTGRNDGGRPEKDRGWAEYDIARTQFKTSTGFKPKDLVPIPWLVALALQADGWWLRSAPPWIKLNCMPESVRDRPTTGHENWFLLTKAARYWYDADAVREQSSMDSGWAKQRIAGRPQEKRYHQGNSDPKGGGYRGDGGFMVYRDDQSPGRNRRTTDFFFESLDARIAQQRAYLRHLEHIKDNGGMLLDEDGNPLAFVFPTKPYSGAHFATFSPDLIRPMIKASTSERGVCPECGAQWGRVTERIGETTTKKRKKLDYSAKRGSGGILVRQNLDYTGAHGNNLRQVVTTGWRPTCTCYDDRRKFPKARRARKRRQRDVSGNWRQRVQTHVQPATVLDPFVGSGTTCLVSRELGRRSIGLDLSFAYLRDQARTRLELDRLKEWENGRDGQGEPLEELPLFRKI